MNDTDNEYGNRFVKAFERHTEGLEFISSGLCASCSDCQSTYDVGEKKLAKLIDEGLSDEGGFSNSGCDTCCSSLGQLLYAGHTLVEIDGKKVLTHLELCEDCILYIANGDIPNPWED